MTEDDKAPGNSNPIAGWIQRYLPAEIAGLVAAYLGSACARSFGAGIAVASYAAAWSESGVFLSVMLVREILADKSRYQCVSGNYGFQGILRSLGNLILEFGVAEILDALVLRPLLIAISTRAFGVGWGIVCGKVTADVCFYTIAIVSRRLRLSFLGSNAPPANCILGKD